MFLNLNCLFVLLLVLLRRQLTNGQESAMNSAEGSYEDVLDPDPDDDQPPFKPKSNGPPSKFIPNKNELHINKPIPDMADLNESNDSHDGPAHHHHHHGPPRPHDSPHDSPPHDSPPPHDLPPPRDPRGPPPL